MALRLATAALLTVLLLGWVAANDHLDLQDEEKSAVRSLTDDEMRMVAEAGYSYVDRLAQIEEDLYAQGIYVKEDSHLYRMSQFKRPTREAMEMSQRSLRLLETTRFLKNNLGLSDEEITASLRDSSSVNLVNTTCLTAPVCTTSKYRTYDGSCNNQAVTNLGQASTVFRRLQTPAYYDGIQEARNTSTNGSALPGARLISTSAFGSADMPMATATSLMMQFGQFINHDMEATNTFSLSNGTGISCCSSSNMALDASQLSPYCLPIDVPTNDPFVNKNKVTQTCMNFVRSITGPRLNCSKALGYADQLNSNTHWLDGSTVYGSSDTKGTSTPIRQYSGGLLLMTNDTTNSRTLLPTSSPCTTGACFYAGDSRATEQPQLTVMHTIWAREHNRVAKALAALNPTWSDESLFQEARRIVVAEMQHITYNEYLPNLLGSFYIAKYGLAPLTSGYVTNFTNYTDGPISNEFATAAFRMGHTMVQGQVLLYDESGNQLSSNTYNMSDYFNDASLIVNNKTYFDNVIRGLVTQPSQSVDQFVVNDLWLQLFKGSSKFGFDIVALNIQRGRDHGLPSYNTYRQYCGFSKLTSFSDLTVNSGTNTPQTNTATAAKIQAVYGTVDDIDLFVGGVTEITTAKTGGLVGPTFSCLIAENFSKLKYGDRYFYEIGGQPHSFSTTQLAQIRKATMARILCDNNDGTVLSMQPAAFLVNSTTNARVLCSNTASIPSLDLTPWKGETLF